MYLDLWWDIRGHRKSSAREVLVASAASVMASHKYEAIADDGEAPAPSGGGRFAVAAVAASAVLGAFALTSTASGQAMGRSVAVALYRAGGALEAPSALSSAGELASCSEVEASLKELRTKDWEVEFDSSTLAPTSTRDWEVFWTDGSYHDGVEDAYVWYTNEYDAGYSATVMINTIGTAEGVDVTTNSTYVYFGANDGSDDYDSGDFAYHSCIGKAAVDGSSVALVVCYGEAGDYNSSNIMGIALYESLGKIYWVDNRLGKLLSADIHENDGTQYEEVADFDSPFDVAVNERGGNLFVSCEDTGIYEIDVDGTDKTQVIDASSGITIFKAVDVDSINGNLYFVGDSGIYVGSTVAVDAYWSLYTDLVEPRGVAVDATQDLVFFTGSSGVYRGDTAGDKKVTIAELSNSRFIAVEGFASPTPAPTPVPTSKPSLDPTPAPSFVPTSEPSYEPTPRPTHVPSPVPTSAPSHTPTGKPTRLPTTLPSPAPTLFPTPTPTALPSGMPSSTPSSAPTPFPTSAPSPSPTSTPTSTPTNVCWKWQQDCGYCSGEAGSECEPHPTTSPTFAKSPKPTSEGHGSYPGPPPPPPTDDDVAAAKESGAGHHSAM